MRKCEASVRNEFLRRGLVAAALMTVPGAAVAQDVTVTLPEAVELALRSQPAVVQARGNIDVANAARREVLGSWLPRLSGSGSYTAQPTSRWSNDLQQFVSAGSSTSQSAGFSASIELFDGFRRLAQGRAAGAQLSSADADLTNQEFQVTLQVKQAFFGALAADELVRISATRIQRAREQLKVATEKLQAGTATRSDTLRSSVELGNAQLALLTAGTQQATARADLARLIGVDRPVRAVADSALFAMAPLDTAALRSELTRSAPAVLAAEAEARSAAATVGVNRAQYFPTVTGSFSQNWSGPVSTGVDSATGRQNTITWRGQWSARLSLSWNVFNGFTREAALTRSVVARETAEAQAADARRQASAQLTQQLAAYESARSRIAITVASRAAAAEDLRVVQERYRLGAATILEVLTSQEAMDQAEVDAIQSQFDFLVARAQLEALLGRAL
jgi:outer membrane protein TolC